MNKVKEDLEVESIIPLMSHMARQARGQQVIYQVVWSRFLLARTQLVLYLMVVRFGVGVEANMGNQGLETTFVLSHILTLVQQLQTIRHCKQHYLPVHLQYLLQTWEVSMPARFQILVKPYAGEIMSTVNQEMVQYAQEAIIGKTIVTPLQQDVMLTTGDIFRSQQVKESSLLILHLFLCQQEITILVVFWIQMIYIAGEIMTQVNLELVPPMETQQTLLLQTIMQQRLAPEDGILVPYTQIRQYLVWALMVMVNLELEMRY